MEVNFEILSQCSLACATRRIDPYVIYAICHEVSEAQYKCFLGGSSGRKLFDTLTRAALVSGAGEPDMLRVLNTLNEGAEYFTVYFDEEVYRGTGAFSMFTPLQRVLLSFRYGVAGRLGKHILMGEEAVPREEWIQVLHAFMSSPGDQVRQLVVEIASQADKCDKKMKLDIWNLVSLWHNNSLQYVPYVAKVRKVYQEVKGNAAIPEHKENTRDLISWE